jgi:HK97 gp10 family phage protein
MMKILKLEALRRKFERMTPAVKKRAQADIMLAGREINVLQRALSPVESGELKASIRTEPYSEPYVGAFVRAGGPTTTKAARAGQGSYDYALAQELGTADVDATPFFYPAVRAKRNVTKRRIRAGIRKGIKEAARGG